MKKYLLLLAVAGLALPLAIQAGTSIAGGLKKNTTESSGHGGYEGLIPPSTSNNYPAGTVGGYAGVTSWKAPTGTKAEEQPKDIYEFVKGRAAVNTPAARRNRMAQQAEEARQRERQAVLKVNAEQTKRRQAAMQLSMKAEMDRQTQIQEQARLRAQSQNPVR
jgi:hypothetical protein